MRKCFDCLRRQPWVIVVDGDARDDDNDYIGHDANDKEHGVIPIIRYYPVF